MIIIFFVSVPPEIIDAESSTSTVNIRENYNASLICKATGTPEPEITWKREDGRKIVIKRKMGVEILLYGYLGGAGNISLASPMHHHLKGQ